MKQIISIYIVIFFSSVVLASENESRIIVPKESEVLFTLGHSKNSELRKKYLKILVWNLHKGSEKYFADNFLELAQDKDLIISQEMYLNREMLTLFSIFNQNYYASATSFFVEKEKIRTGVITGADAIPSNVQFIRTKTLEPFLNSPKLALITSYPLKKSKKSLTIINIHSINFVKNEFFKNELDRIYEVVKNLPSPIIFAGDFNTWNKFRLNYLDQIKKKLNLEEATFLPDNRMRFNGHPLDHFLHSKDIEVISAKADDFYEGSDHRPLELEITLKALPL